MREEWEDGPAFQALKKKQHALQQQRERIEACRKVTLQALQEVEVLLADLRLTLSLTPGWLLSRFELIYKIGILAVDVVKSLKGNTSSGCRQCGRGCHHQSPQRQKVVGLGQLLLAVKFQQTVSALKTT